ncbi:MAG: tetratricopeptide repeat protein [Acidobacteriia bacterium]|nr:tetratricopeptide repeat protein [Terriglobia bacterium]
MKLTLRILMLLAGFAGEAAGQGAEFLAGRAYYSEGEFSKAAARFQLALNANPGDAEACYWAGMAYQRLADIATPFGAKDRSKTRAYLTRAMNLAPGRSEYRQALFDVLLDSAYSSRKALRYAADILLTMSESDPDYSEMRRRYDNEKRLNSPAQARFGRLFLMAPRAAYRIAALPASALSPRHATASLPPSGQ